MGHRFYDPVTARFVTRDTIGDLGGLNNYEYAGNNPVNEFDPSGYYSAGGDYFSHAGQYFVGEVEGLGNFAGSTATSPLVVAPWMLDMLPPQTAAKLSHPFNPCGEDAEDGDIFGQGLGFVGSLFTGAGEEEVVAAGATKLDRVVIGKVADLNAPGALEDGERLLDLPNLGSPKLNWAQNSSRLREAMQSGEPIRDASVDPVTGELLNNTGFLRAERNLLQNQGWTYNPVMNLWHP